MKNKTFAVALVALVGALVVIGAIGDYFGRQNSTTAGTTTAGTNTSSTTTGTATSNCQEMTLQTTTYCLGIWYMPFTVIVNYTGSWEVSYLAYNTGVKDVSGLYSGTGYNVTMLNFEAYGFSQPRACATATKQDSSNRTLALTLLLYTNNTSIPYGSVDNCYSEQGS